MKERRWITITGRLRKGYRVASGPSRAYPEYGSIEKQKPFFKKLGLNLDRMFNGTLNISIAPYEFEMKNPAFKFQRVKWTELTNAETFSFSPCKVKFDGKVYSGWVYYPDPRTKRDHFQSPSTVEVLAPYIAGIKYRDKVELSLDLGEIEIFHPNSRRRRQGRAFFD